MRARTLGDDLHDLAELSREQLVESWQAFLHCDPPKGLSTQLMVRAIAYEMQARTLGKLPQFLKMKLRDIVKASLECRDNAGCTLTPGTRLVREWQGTVHVVDVMDEGFRWQDRVRPSLSVIAREITGTRWSGPRFFGLKTRSGKAA